MRIQLISLVVAMTFFAAPARAGEPPQPQTQTLDLTARAVCRDGISGPALALGPACTFDGWAAKVGDELLPAKHATGKTWLPSCVLDGDGVCSFAVTATGRVAGDGFEVDAWTVAPVGNVTAVGRMLVPADVACTEEECPAADPCCHGCNHGGWMVMNRRPELRAIVAAEVPPLPRCELDGCGGCDHRLTAWGVEVGGIFIVSSHGQTDAVALMPSARCTMMACGSANPCCNNCGFMGWTAHGSTGTLSAVAGEGVEPLPEGEVDGCGRCPWQLLVDGEEKDGKFVVTSWKRFP